MAWEIRHSKARLLFEKFYFRWFALFLQVIAVLMFVGIAVWIYHSRAPWSVVAVASVLGAVCIAVILLISHGAAATFPALYRSAYQALDIYEAYRDQRGFFLYLRSFQDSISATTTRSFTGDEGQVTHVFENLSQLLDDALSQFGRVLFIGKESTDMFAEYGLVIDSTDETWRSLFRDCAGYARGILIAPGETPGVLEEMFAVAREALAMKAVWIMRANDNAGERGTRWAAISEVMRLKGIDLPRYDERGALFTLADGNCWKVVTFRRWWPTETQAIRGAFRRIIKARGPEHFASGLPLCEMLTQIKLKNFLYSNASWIVPNTPSRLQKAQKPPLTS